MAYYNERNLREETIWHMNKRIKTDFDTFDSKGGLLKGRVDVGWKFWKDPNIVVQHYIVLKSDGNRERFNRDSIKLEMHWTSDRETELGYTGYFDRTSVLDGGIGVVAISIEFIDMKGWVEVYPKIPDGMGIVVNNRYVQAKVIPRRDVQILVQVDDDFDDTDISYDVPFDLLHQNAWLNFNTSTYGTVSVEEGGEQLDIKLISGGEFKKVWIRYK